MIARIALTYNSDSGVITHLFKNFSRIYEKMVLVKTFVGETETGRFILKLLGLICDSEQSLNANFKVKWESGIIIHVILKF